MTLRHLFAHPWLLVGLLALLALSVQGLWARWRRRRALARMGDRVTIEGQLIRGRWSRWLRGTLLSLGLLGLAVGLAGPRWGRDWEQALAPGRDLIVVLDASRSMLAEQPSRLERAQRALLDLAQTLRRRGGHRVALVGFAGQARLLCPLTHDYDHFTELIEGFDGEVLRAELGPGAESLSGTRIGAGLLTALEARDPRYPEYTDILLLSDGDDPARDGEWRLAVERAREAKVPVHVVGIGVAERGQRIPTQEGWAVYEGQEVRTRLQVEPLEEISTRTHGRLELAGTRAVPLGALYQDIIRDRSERETRDDALPVYRLRYLWFLLPAFALICLGLALPDRWRGPRKKSGPRSP
jgi:Ca-activated chloride channel family protein